MAMDLNGKSALVTGGGSGLGAATARALAERGAKVALLDVNKAAAAALAEEIGGMAIACDVSDAASAEAAVAEATTVCLRRFAGFFSSGTGDGGSVNSVSCTFIGGSGIFGVIVWYTHGTIMAGTEYPALCKFTRNAWFSFVRLITIVCNSMFCCSSALARFSRSETYSFFLARLFCALSLLRSSLFRRSSSVSPKAVGVTSFPDAVALDDDAPSSHRSPFLTSPHALNSCWYLSSPLRAPKQSSKNAASPTKPSTGK